MCRPTDSARDLLQRSRDRVQEAERATATGLTRRRLTAGGPLRRTEYDRRRSGPRDGVVPLALSLARAGLLGAALQLDDFGFARRDGGAEPGVVRRERIRREVGVPHRHLHALMPEDLL